MSPAPLIIATRESALALWQAGHVRDRLQALHPEIEVRLLGMTTRGDRILDRPLNAVGGKGLFIKELEVALREGSAHIAVHSLKDVPMDLLEGFTLAALSAREDPRDAFVSNRHAGLAELPAGARVGTSSLRRQAQLKARRPDLVIRPLRGNVQTRLRALDADEYDAIILAAAGLKRLGLGSRVTAHLSPEESLPAIGQGVLAVECLSGDRAVIERVRPLHDADTADCVAAERAFGRRLQGGCQLPLAAHAELGPGGRLRLRGLVASPDGARVLHDEMSGDRGDAAALGTALAERLWGQGAGEILAEAGGAHGV